MEPLVYLIFLTNTMPKCIGCKKDFQSHGYPAHKRSCKRYKRELKARLATLPDFGLLPGPCNEPMILEDVGELGFAGDMRADEVQPEVGNGLIK